MSEIVETYQQEESIKEQELPQIAIATVVEVTDAGLIVLFDGEEEPSAKPFPCNVGVTFNVGQRVLMQKVNDLYIALCPVGLKGSAADVFSRNHNGLVPAPTSSSQESQFLRGDGTWQDAGGSTAITVDYYTKSISCGTMSANTEKEGTFSDSAPSGSYHMGVCGVYTNTVRCVANCGVSSMSNSKGGSASLHYQIANPTETAVSNVYIYVMMRYLHIG